MIYPESVIGVALAFWEGTHANLKRATLEAVINEAGDTGAITPSQCKKCLRQIHVQLTVTAPAGSPIRSTVWSAGRWRKSTRAA